MALLHCAAWADRTVLSVELIAPLKSLEYSRTALPLIEYYY